MMDTVLLSVTALSLVLSTGLAVIVAKLLGDERRRSDARVAALSELAAEPERLDHDVVTLPVARVAVPPRPPVAARPMPIAPAPVRHAAGVDLQIRPLEPGPGVGELFSQPDVASPWRGRLAIAGSIAAVILVAVALSSSRAPDTRAAAAPSNRATAAEPAPLELLSLRHERQEQRLTITGLVQNPRSSAPLSRVVATALVFGPGGAFLSSGRAPLDFSTLAPGDESPFVVDVTVTGLVDRYRIAFRSEDGRVLAHIDKRGPDAVARK